MRSLLLLLAFSPCALAHVDPGGDVHPQVSPEGDGFVVRFSSQQPPRWQREYRSMRFNVRGERVGDTEPAEPDWDPGADPNLNLPVRLPEPRTGLVLEDGDGGFYVVPQYHRKHGGKPYLIRIRDGEQYELRPDWGESKVDLVHEALLTPTRIVLLLTDDGAEDFALVAIDRQTGAIERRRSIGVPSRIYRFPACSNLVEFAGDVFFAWIGPVGDGWALHLQRWSPESDTLDSVRRPEPASWNTGLSMARVRNRALLAYHYAADHRGIARIVTVALDLAGDLAGSGDAAR